MKRESNVKLNANIGEIRINNYDTAIKGNGYENLENDVVKLTKSGRPMHPRPMSLSGFFWKGRECILYGKL